MGRAKPDCITDPTNVPLERGWLGGRPGRCPCLFLPCASFLSGSSSEGGGVGAKAEDVGGAGRAGEGVKPGLPPRPRRPGRSASLRTAGPSLKRSTWILFSGACPSSPVSSLRPSVSRCVCLSNVTAAQVPQPWQDRPQWNFEGSSGTHELLVNINSERGERRQTPSLSPQAPGARRGTGGL